MSSTYHLKVVHRRRAGTKRKGPFGCPTTTTKQLVKAVKTPPPSSTDYATMPKAVRTAMLADLEAHYLHNNEERSVFDPSGLPELALAKCPGHPWLAEALRACTVQWKRNELYTYFIDPATRATEWKFQCTLMLDCPVRGGLAIDILKGNRIGGIEFLDAVMGRPTSAEALERTIRALQPIRNNK